MRYEGCEANSSAPEALLSQFYAAVSPVVFNRGPWCGRAAGAGLDGGEGKGGQPEGYCHRQMIDAVLYVVTGL